MQFSLMVASMRQTISSQIAGAADKRKLIDLAFSSLTAQPVADAFFGMCRSIVDLDKGEQAIEAQLRKCVNEEIKRRNDIVHGDWIVADWATAESGAPSPTLVRIKASSVKQPFEHQDFAVSQIEEICAEVEALHHVVWVLGTVCTGEHSHGTADGLKLKRVRDALRIDNGRVNFCEGRVYMLNPYGNNPHRT